MRSEIYCTGMVCNASLEIQSPTGCPTAFSREKKMEQFQWKRNGIPSMEDKWNIFSEKGKVKAYDDI